MKTEIEINDEILVANSNRAQLPDSSKAQFHYYGGYIDALNFSLGKTKPLFRSTDHPKKIRKRFQ